MEPFGAFGRVTLKSIAKTLEQVGSDPIVGPFSFGIGEGLYESVVSSSKESGLRYEYGRTFVGFCLVLRFDDGLSSRR